MDRQSKISLVLVVLTVIILAAYCVQPVQSPQALQATPSRAELTGTVYPMWVEVLPDRSFENPLCNTNLCDENKFVNYAGTEYAVTAVSGFVQIGTMTPGGPAPAIRIKTTKQVNARNYPGMFFSNGVPSAAIASVKAQVELEVEVIPNGNDYWGKVGYKFYIPLRYQGILTTTWRP